MLKHRFHQSLNTVEEEKTTFKAFKGNGSVNFSIRSKLNLPTQ